MKTTQVPEALFYHLTTRPLERTLPTLLERTLQKGWRAVVRAGSMERIAALDALLWTYRDDSFLPHGTPGNGSSGRQPIYLTDGDEIPNAAQALFLVDGADTEDFAVTERVVVMFDGADDDAVAFAREQWTRAAASVPATYWRQSEAGQWEKAHETAPA